MSLDNAFPGEVQAGGSGANASAGGTGDSFMPKLEGRCGGRHREATNPAKAPIAVKETTNWASSSPQPSLKP